jgi:probable rRNA maturation factor
MAPRAILDTRSIYLGSWRIDISTRPGVPRLSSLAVVARTIGRALDVAGAPRPASIGLILADDAELTGLNGVHMGKDGPTDVLSFPLLTPDAFPSHPGGSPRDVAAAAPSAAGGADGGAARGFDFALPPGRRLHLGDIVVSVERAIEQAQAGRGGQTGQVRWSPADELRLLVTHGTLHVCGWDHAEPAEEGAMRALEQELLGC